MKDLFKPTLNGMGFETTKIDSISDSFIKYAVCINDWVLEIGSARGNLIKSAVNNEIKIYCNDASEDHINQIKSDHANNCNVKYFVGDFLSVDFGRKFKAILCARVLHFLNPFNLEKAFEVFSDILDYDGKLFITVETPFLGNWKSFLVEYQERLDQNLSYPGYISDTQEFETKGYKKNLPNEVHWLNKLDFDYLAKKFHFEIEHMEYINRKGYFPDDLLLDGRESLGVILRKKTNISRNS